MRYEHISICSYIFISDPMAGLVWTNVRSYIPLKTSKSRMNGLLVSLRILYEFDKPLEAFLRLMYNFYKPSEAFFSS